MGRREMLQLIIFIHVLSLANILWEVWVAPEGYETIEGFFYGAPGESLLLLGGVDKFDS